MKEQDVQRQSSGNRNRSPTDPNTLCLRLLQRMDHKPPNKAQNNPQNSLRNRRQNNYTSLVTRVNHAKRTQLSTPY